MEVVGVNINRNTMMYKSEPFNNLWEHYMSRYTAGCFNAGDTIEFNKKIFSDEAYKNLQPDLAQKLKDMVDAQIAGDAIIMVTNVSIEPLHDQQAHPSTISIAYSLGGGRWYDEICIPGHLLAHMKRIENGANQASTIPANKKINYDEKFSKTAFELDLKDGEKKRTQGHVTSTLM
jgi:hypothetical protein